MADDEEISVYDEVEIEDMTYDEALQTYFYPCPCGDRFQIALADLQDEETDIAVCPSCSLMIRVIYEVVSLCSSRPPPPRDTVHCVLRFACATKTRHEKHGGNEHKKIESTHPA